MSTPFICSRCIARLTRSHVSRLRPKRSQLHTEALPSSASQPVWTSSVRKPGVSAEDDITDYRKPQLPTPHTGPFVSQIPGYESVVKRETRWTKFFPRRRLDTARRAHARIPITFRQQRLKVLKSRGNFMFIRGDLAYMYGLTNHDARHAVNQLGRLLGGRDSGKEAGKELDRYHDWKRHLTELLKLSKTPQLTPNDDDDLIQINTEADAMKPSWETLRGVWSGLDNERRKSMWPDHIASTFRSNPDMLPGVVLTTFNPTWCSSYVVEDLVYLLLRSLDDIQDRRERSQQIVDLVFFLLQNSPPRYLLFDQWTIWKMISLIPTFRVFEFYEALRNIEHPLRQNTLLHIARRLAVRSKYKAQAADVMCFLSTTPRFDINAPAASSVCTTLFTMQEGDIVADDHAAPDDLFRTLLDVGFRPNLLSLSALMRNFCLRGRVDVAWSIFNRLLEAGIEPDAYVFSILLNGSKQFLDMESVQRDIDMIEATEGWTPVLLNDFLDYIYQVCESQDEQRRGQRKRLGAKAWRLMYQLYSKFFHLAPLQKLTLFPLGNLDKHLDATPHPHLEEVTRMVANLRRRSDDLLMQPDNITLDIMFRAHFRSIDTPGPLRVYYKYFMSLLHFDDPILVSLIKGRGTLVHDIFIRDFLQFKETFNIGVQMIPRMFKYAKLEKPRRGENILHPPPSTHTYTILMNGYRNHNSCKGVIRTLNEMIEKGITPNIVTWNIVIGSLLEFGAIARAVRTVLHLNHIGLQPNDRTIREVTRLSLGKRKLFAECMAKLEKRPDDIDSRIFANSLFQVWNRKKQEPKEPDISQKDARLINKFYQHIEGENLRWNAGQREEEDKPKVEEKREDRDKDMELIMALRKQSKENKASRRETTG
ncbi:hypothetical protein F4781DRAFT_388672 [Annulohypoxylon bovei var. microspora]|nr:hypothetical protein F4781DRAFT_388672 [Annulohypoxylon bovei var. microspora]